MAKIEDSHFMHQTVRVCHTDHPDSIISSMVDLKNNFLYNRKITLYIWRKSKRLKILILCTRLLEFVTLITLIASFLPWLILKISFYNRKITLYIMAKIEAVEDSHFMHQTVRVCHTDHPDSIVSSMACIVDLKKKVLM